MQMPNSNAVDEYEETINYQLSLTTWLMRVTLTSTFFVFVLYA